MERRFSPSPSPPANSSTFTTVSPSTNFSNNTTINVLHRRLTPQTLSVPPGHIAFRILCHASRIGRFIGKSGAAIKQIQQGTSAIIRVEDAPQNCIDRVILVIASTTVNNTISVCGSLDASDCDNDAASEDRMEVSAAQETLVRCFERILHVASVTEGVYAVKGAVSFRLLVEGDLVGAVIGKGGKNISNMRKESGCRITFLKGDMLPACARPSDEMLEIEGDSLSVKKALISISGFLQELTPAADNMRMIGFARNFHEDPFPDFPADPRRQRLPMTSSPFTYSSGDCPSFQDSQTLQQEVVLKILCTENRIGGIIGKGGNIIKLLQNQTGASLIVGPPVPDCDERLITITAFEDSVAEKALRLVFTRSIEVGIENRLDSGWGVGSNVTARLVAPSFMGGCLIGKGGSIISEIRKATSTGIWVIGIDKVPKCVSEDDVVVQIDGEFVNVQEAICCVCFRFRRNNISSGIPRDVGFFSRSNYAHKINRSHTANNRDPSHCTDHPSPSFQQSEMGVHSSGLTDIDNGLTSLIGSLELGSGCGPAVVTNATLEIVVPESVMNLICADNGSNLTRLRQISGAKVKVQEPNPSTSDRIFIISGTPDETQAAQSLLKAFTQNYKGTAT